MPVDHLIEIVPEMIHTRLQLRLEEMPLTHKWWSCFTAAGKGENS